MKDSNFKTLLVAFLLCVICSTFVSVAAVLLKERQEKNQALDKKKNILLAAGLYESGQVIGEEDIDRLYRLIRPQVIDFEEGVKTDAVDPFTYDQLQMAKDPKNSIALSQKEDLAQVRRRARYGLLYEVVNENNELQAFIIPIRGYGLWSTLYGFLAVDKNASVVKNITYYQHAETPGLGGEVDNPKWKKIWVDKRVYDDQKQVLLKVIKGPAAKDNVYQVDGLSGATITSKGVSDMIAFWFSDKAYGKFLKKKL